jgi:hypothetical protein
MCNCGALGLGAPTCDTDEIIDDVINVWGPIPDAYMTSFVADRVAGLQQIGVEVAEGQAVVSSAGDPLELRVIWFRQKPVQAN